MPVRLVSHLEASRASSETLRVGDLNGDGAPDLLVARSVYETRELRSLTALTIRGETLWQWGDPAGTSGRIYSDLPVQIYDWDDDGRNEVLLVQQAVYAEVPDGWARERAFRYEGEARMLILDGATGLPKGSFPLPAPADDCFLLADLTGRGRREDLVVKDRYWNMWGIAHDGRVLWHYPGSVGHFPAIADVDGDDKDEVFVGFALVDHDGTVLFQHDAGDAHQDAACIVRLDDGSWRMIFGNHGLHCLDLAGRELWFHPLPEAQHVLAGRFRKDSPLQVAVINRGHAPREGAPRNPATLLLYDLQGREIWRREQTAGSWAAAIAPINWFGPRQPEAVLVYARGQGQPAAIYDGAGQIVDALPLPPAGSTPAHYYGLAADVWGDSRDEVILFGPQGLCIYANTRPLAVPTLYNETLYPGM